MLGLSTPVNGPPSDPKPATDNSNDIFGYFMSENTTNGKTTTTTTTIAAAAAASAVPSTNTNTKKEEPTLAQQEHDFFNQIPNEKEKAKMTKDSILALYGAAPSGGMCAPGVMPTNNQFMPGLQTMNADNGSLFGMQMPVYQQQPAFGMQANPPTVSGLNNFAQFGLMQQNQPMNFQPANSINSMPNQSMGFANVPQVNPSLQSFNQSNATKNNTTFPTANHTPNVKNVNQQFGSLNLGNVWQ